MAHAAITMVMRLGGLLYLMCMPLCLKTWRSCMCYFQPDLPFASPALKPNDSSEPLLIVDQFKYIIAVDSRNPVIKRAILKYNSTARLAVLCGTLVGCRGALVANTHRIDLDPGDQSFGCTLYDILLLLRLASALRAAYQAGRAPTTAHSRFTHMSSWLGVVATRLTRSSWLEHDDGHKI